MKMKVTSIRANALMAPIAVAIGAEKVPEQTDSFTVELSPVMGDKEPWSNNLSVGAMNLPLNDASDFVVGKVYELTFKAV